MTEKSNRMRSNMIRKTVFSTGFSVALLAAFIAVQPIREARSAAAPTEVLVAISDTESGETPQCGIPSTASLQIKLEQLQQAGVVSSCSDQTEILDTTEMPHSFNSGAAVELSAVEEEDSAESSSTSSGSSRATVAVCSSQYINVYRIPSGQLPQARRLGFTPVAQIRGYRRSNCD